MAGVAAVIEVTDAVAGALEPLAGVAAVIEVTDAVRCSAGSASYSSLKKGAPVGA